jgi:hypothetical protein
MMSEQQLQQIVEKREFAKKWYFEKICWIIKQHPKEAFYTNGNDENKSFTDHEFNIIHHIDCNTAYLIVPLTRFQEVSDIIPLGSDLTLGGVLNAIYDFYHKPLTNKEVEKIKNFPKSFHYEDALITKFEQGETVCYADLRGESKYFEGIQRVENNIYRLKLGS